MSVLFTSRRRTIALVATVAVVGAGIAGGIAALAEGTTNPQVVQTVGPPITGHPITASTWDQEATARFVAAYDAAYPGLSFNTSHGPITVEQVAECVARNLSNDGFPYDDAMALVRDSTSPVGTSKDLQYANVNLSCANDPGISV